MVTVRAIRPFAVRGQHVDAGALIEVEPDIARLLVAVLAAVVESGELPPAPPPRRTGRRCRPPSTWPSELRHLGLGEQLAHAGQAGRPWLKR